MRLRRLGCLVVFIVVAGCGRTELVDVETETLVSRDGGACPARGTDAQTVTELLRRWNAAVDAGQEAIDYHWNRADAFPHPTYRWGSAEAYAQFVDVLLRFWAAPGNVEFARCNELLDRTWGTEGPTTVQLRAFTQHLSTFSLVDERRRGLLATACVELECVAP